MLRTAFSYSQMTAAAGARAIAGVAPVLYFAPKEAKLSKEQQLKKNTSIAIQLIRKFKGTVPAPYQRCHKQTIEQVRADIEALLGGAEKMRRKASDDQPMDKLTLMERCLRHGLWMYLKDEGKYDFAAMEKWLVYTQLDESKINQLKREVETKEKYAAFKKKRAEAGGAAVALPTFNWAAEYTGAIDREVVVEKRLRYDLLAVSTTERDEKAVEAVLEEYKRPLQDKRLDDLIDMLEKFKPVLAREAIMQRLTVKHLEGQLGVWRYMDWNPEVRDRAELEADNYCQQWWAEFEEKRLAAVRLRSANEVKEIAEKSQAALMAKTAQNQSVKTSKGSGDSAAREKLLREVLALQARIGKKDEDAAPKEEPKKAHH
jgi:hypothetical protein